MIKYLKTLLDLKFLLFEEHFNYKKILNIYVENLSLLAENFLLLLINY